MAAFGSVVAVVGSRRLPPGGAARVAVVSRALVASGRSLVVGCCAGADAAALSAVAPGAVSVLAAFGPSGEGACAWSSVPAVLAFARAGGSVRWWAGGGPSVPLRTRLAARTRAVSAAGVGGVVAFFAAPSSRGSLLACEAAVRSGRPVLAFPLGFVGESLPLLGPGCWVPEAGEWSGAFRWHPAPGLF